MPSSASYHDIQMANYPTDDLYRLICPWFLLAAYVLKFPLYFEGMCKFNDRNAFPNLFSVRFYMSELVVVIVVHHVD